MDENGIRKGDRLRDVHGNAKLDFTLGCGTGCSFGIDVAVFQVLWYICCACHHFMLRGLLCKGEKMLRKAIDVNYNFNAPQISFVYFIMLMNIITRDF